MNVSVCEVSIANKFAVLSNYKGLPVKTQDEFKTFKSNLELNLHALPRISLSEADLGQL